MGVSGVQGTIVYGGSRRAWRKTDFRGGILISNLLNLVETPFRDLSMGLRVTVVILCFISLPSSWRDAL